MPLIPCLQNHLPKVIPLTANSTASLDKKTVPCLSWLNSQAQRQRSHTIYRCLHHLLKSLFSFIGALSVFSVFPPILHLREAFRSPADGVSAVNTRCQLSSDFLHAEQILNFPGICVQGGVVDFEMGVDIDPGGHEALTLFFS